MPLHYFKRFRMEIDLRNVPVGSVGLPEGYHWVPWDPLLIERHAFVKFRSFREEVDSLVFPCLGDFAGCLRLMQDIASQPGFLPPATWMIAFVDDPRHPPVDCGTIQGLAQSEVYGSVQNVGVVAEHRGRGLGRALMRQALSGFQAMQLRRVCLEVTATNDPAVELYRSLGFTVTRTMYRPLAPELANLPL